MERDAIDLGTVKVSVLFRRYFLPTLFGMLSMSAVTAADGIFIGRGIGSDGIAAVNICIPLMMIFTGIGLMSGVGCSVVASIHLSAGRVKAAGLNVTQAMAFVTALAFPAALSMMIFCEDVASALGSSATLMDMVVDYLLWFLPGLTFNMWISVGLFVIRLDGAPSVAMWCSVVSAIVNVILDWIFIFPLGWGVMGAAFASSVSLAIGGVAVVVYLLCFAKHLRLRPLKRSAKSLRLSMRNIGYHCKIGLSALLGETTLAMLMLVGNFTFMHYLGDDGVGAFGVACYYAPFVFMLGNAIAQSAQPIISYNSGLKNRSRVFSAARLSVMTAVAGGLVVASAFILFPQVLVGLFLDAGNASAHIATDGFPYFALGFVFFIVNLTVIGYFQSIERVRPATTFALLRGFVFLVPSFVLLPKTVGNVGIWLAMPLSEMMTTVAIVAFFLSHNRRGA